MRDLGEVGKSMRTVAELMSQLEDVVGQLLERLEAPDSDDLVQRKVLQDAIDRLKGMGRPIPAAMLTLHAELEATASHEEVPLGEIRQRLQILLERIRTKKGAPPLPPAGGISKQRLAELIVATLREHGGSVPATTLIQYLHERHQHEFSPDDLEVLSQGRPRWRERAKRAREQLVREGILEDTPGTWTLAQC